MDEKALKAFCEAYEAGSITGAAEGALVARQALSRTLRGLESELGCDLLERGAAGVRPTAFGRAAYPHARRALDECQAIRSDARKYRRGMGGALLLAVEPNAMFSLPWDLLARYREARPGVELGTCASHGRASLEALACGEVDAVLSVPWDDERFCYAPLYRGELCAVFRSGAAASASRPGSPRLAGHEAGGAGGGDAGPLPECPQAVRLGPASLEGMTLFGVDSDHPVERRVQDYLRGLGVSAEVSYDYPSGALALGAMARGLGASLVERGGIAQFDSPDYAVVVFSGPGAPAWEVGLTWRRESLKAAVADDFLSFASAALREGRQGGGGAR